MAMPDSAWSLNTLLLSSHTALPVRIYIHIYIYTFIYVLAHVQII